MEINREQFEAWLFSQPRGRSFVYVNGLSSEQPGCVMCSFLREQTNARTFGFAVGDTFTHFYDVDLSYIREELPLWFIDMKLVQVKPLTAGNVQDLYCQLFNFETPKSQPAENLDCSHLEPIAPRTNSLLSDVNASKTTV